MTDANIEKSKLQKEILKRTIKARIEKYGPNCNLNDLDVSSITDMSYLFCRTEFNGDISKWNVSRVRNMSYMFAHSDFEQNLSNWTIVPGTLTVCMLQRDTPHDIPFPPRFRPKGLKRDAY